MSKFAFKIRALGLVVVFLVALGFPTLTNIAVVQAQTPSPTSAAVSETTSSGPHFFTGESVVLTEDLSGDVYVFAQNVIVEGHIDGDLLVAGGQVTVIGNVADNIRAAGANVDIRGGVGGNVTVASGTFTLDRQAQIAESLVAAAGNLDVYGQIGGTTWLRGSVVTFGGQVAQDVTISAEKATIQDTTAIGGNLTTKTTEPVSVPSEAQIGGTQTLEKTQTDEMAKSKLDDVLKVGLVGVVIFFFMSLVTGGILMAVFPTWAQRSADTILTRPWASFGWGLSYFILTPVAVLLLLVTIIGLPLGIVLLLLYILSLILGGLVAAYAVGRKLFSPENPNYTTHLGQFGLGLVILQAVELIPILGWIVKFVALVLGMGALVIQVKDSIFGVHTGSQKSHSLTVVTPASKSDSSQPTAKTKTARTRSKRRTTSKK